MMKLRLLIRWYRIWTYTFTILLGLGSNLLLAQDSLKTDSGGSLHLDLRPELGTTRQAVGIRVHLTWRGLNRASNLPLSLAFDTLKPSLQRTRDQVTNLVVMDSLGSVGLNGPDEKQQGDTLNDVWSLKRQVHGALRLSYFVPVALPLTSKRGPHLDLQAAGNGISGAFAGFLLAPRVDGQIRVHVRWILPPGQKAVSTHALGNFSSEMTLNSLKATLFLAGPLTIFPATPPKSGISFYSLGLSSKELLGFTGWTRKAYEAELNAFHGERRPFRFLIRSYKGGPIASGRADKGAFMLYLPSGEQLDPLPLHELISHEIVHALIKDLDDAPGDEGDWYTEGTADYFAIVLPYGSHLYSNEEYLELINDESALYYTNALRNVSNHDLMRVMWSGRNAWTVPYARGALYLANLDAKLVQHHSRSSVLSLVNETSDAIRAGAPATNESWRDILAREIGPWAISDFDSMLRGELVQPTEGTFGEEVRSVPIRTGFFDLGFARPLHIDKGSQIQGVLAESKAAKAGLQDGMTIVKSLDLNPLYRSFSLPIQLQVLAGNRTVTITYDPHVGLENAFKWVPADRAF